MLSNGNRPGDETLPSFERATLEACVLPVSRVLRLLGYDPATADDAFTTPIVRTRSSRFHGISMADLIGAGLLAAGTRLVSVNTVWPASAVVAVSGAIEMEGKGYPTPSAAAAAVKGTGQVNGWGFCRRAEWEDDAGDASGALRGRARRWERDDIGPAILSVVAPIVRTDHA